MSENVSSKSNKRGSVLIVGGGIGGMQSPWTSPTPGFRVHMVQKIRPSVEPW